MTQLHVKENERRKKKEYVSKVVDESSGVRADAVRG